MLRIRTGRSTRVALWDFTRRCVWRDHSPAPGRGRMSCVSCAEGRHGRQSGSSTPPMSASLASSRARGRCCGAPDQPVSKRSATHRLRSTPYASVSQRVDPPRRWSGVLSPLTPSVEASGYSFRPGSGVRRGSRITRCSGATVGGESAVVRMQLEQSPASSTAMTMVVPGSVPSTVANRGKVSKIVQMLNCGSTSGGSSRGGDSIEHARP